MELEVPMSTGKSVTVTGTRHGRFLVHRPAFGMPPVGWNVTLITTKLKFPCDFPTRKAALEFVKLATPLMDWDSVVVAAPAQGALKGRWVKGTPTLKQKKQIRALMEKLSA